jgi:hypothetical protein
MLEYRGVLGPGQHASIMSVLLILAIVLPIVGAAGVLVLSRFPATKPGANYLALGSAVLTTVCVIVLVAAGRDVSLQLGRAGLLGLEGAAELRHTPVAGAVTLVVVLATLASLLVGLSGAQQGRPFRTASVLWLLAATLVALWARDPLIAVVGWTVYDVVLFLSQLCAGVSAASAVRTLVFGGLATILLWIGALAHGTIAPAETWSGLAAGGPGALAVLFAAVIRLWVYPVHRGAPDELDARQPLGMPLLLGPALGWTLWLHVAVASGDAVLGGWSGLLGAAGLTVGAFLAWATTDSRRTLVTLATACAAEVLLASALAGDQAKAVLAAGAISWILALAVLWLVGTADEKSAWWVVPRAIASWSLAGGPAALGFVAGAHLMHEAARPGRLLETLAFFVGNSFLVAALLRSWRVSARAPRSLGRGAAVAAGLGLSVPAAVLLVAGLHPPLLVPVDPPPMGLVPLLGLPAWPGWLLWAGSLAAGAAIAWQDAKLRTRINLILAAARDLLHLDWLYEGALAASEQVLKALQTAEELVTGRGGLLWSTLLLLLFALLWGSLS